MYPSGKRGGERGWKKEAGEESEKRSLHERRVEYQMSLFGEKGTHRIKNSSRLSVKISDNCTIRQISVLTNEYVDRWVAGWMDECWMDGWMDGWMNGWTYG